MAHAHLSRQIANDLKRWPYGKPTTECQVCHGAGISKAAADDFVKSRNFVGANTLEAPSVKCKGCDGRGRVLTDP